MLEYYKKYFIPRLLTWSKEKPLVLFYSILFLPIAISIRIIKPLIHIRIGGLTSQRMGHYFFDIEHYLSEKKYNTYFFSNHRTFDFFYHHSKPVNNYVKKIASRHIIINDFFKYLDFASRSLPYYDNHRLLLGNHRNRSRDTNAVFNKIPPSLYFNKFENEKGEDFLRKFNINGSFVCLMIRDDAYMKNQFSEDSSDYHNYRDSEIDSFNETINYLASKGIYSIRMGKYVNSKMTIKSKYAFDYATSGERSDFLDLWIISRCMFAISTTAGIETVAVAFRKPLLLVDHLPYGDARTGNDKCIEVFKYILDKNNQMISLNDQIELGLVMSKHTNKITANGRNIKNNTSLEILNATQELMSLINGDLQLSKDEEELQEKFWEILKHWDLYTELHGDVHPVISPSYLSKNKEWLLS